MFPQPKKWPRYVVGAIVLVFVVNEPVTAAHIAGHLTGLLSRGADALSQFATALHAD